LDFNDGEYYFSIVVLILIPFLGHPDIYHAPLYNIKHLGSLMLGVGSFLFLWWFLNFCRKRKIAKVQSILLLVFAGLAFILILLNIFPLVFQEIISALKEVNIGMVPHELAQELVGEMSPLGIIKAFNSFGGLLYFSFIALGFIIYNFIKSKKAEDFLIIIWFLVNYFSYWYFDS